jgi:hypothetical protein
VRHCGIEDASVPSRYWLAEQEPTRTKYPACHATGSRHGEVLGGVAESNSTPETIQALSACIAVFSISPIAILNLREGETNQHYFNGFRVGKTRYLCVVWPEHRDVEVEGQDGAICHHLHHYPMRLASDLTPTQAQSINTNMCNLDAQLESPALQW